MRILRIAAAICLALALLGSSILAAGFANTGIGTKARGMGGAFRAVADDWTAAMYNPAGYAYIKDNQFGGNSAFMHFRNELIPNYRLNNQYDLGVANDITQYNYHEVLSNPSAGIVLRLPVWGETVFGLSAYQRFDQNVTWQLFSPLRAYNDSADVEIPTDQYRNNLDVVTFQLTASREFIPDKLSIGIGLQVLRADLLYRNVTFRNTVMTEEPWTDEPYTKIPELSMNDGSGWGLPGFNLGVMYKVNPKMNLAFTVDLPPDITIDGDAELLFIMPKITTLTGPRNIVAPGTLGYLFANGDLLTLPTKFETKLKLPPTVALGMSYRVNEKLLVAADAEYTVWSRFTGLTFDYNTITTLPPVTDEPDKLVFFSESLESPVEYRNTVKLMGGASYDALPYLTLYGGVTWDEAASRDLVAVTPQFADAGDKLGLNLGLQFHVQRWDLGLAGGFINYDDATVTSMDKNKDNVLEGFPGDYSAQTYETILSFNYRF